MLVVNLVTSLVMGFALVKNIETWFASSTMSGQTKVPASREKKCGGNNISNQQPQNQHSTLVFCAECKFVQ